MRISYRFNRILTILAILTTVSVFAFRVLASPLPGAFLGSKITVGDTANTYAIADANYLEGGHQTVPTHAALLAITRERREIGMLVTVLDDDSITTGNQTVTYRLISNPTSDGSGGTPTPTTDVNWMVVIPSLTNNAGKFLTTDGNTISWGTVSSGVTSFNGRTGAVTPQASDYATNYIQNTTTQQTADFNISGDGTLAGNIIANGGFIGDGTGQRDLTLNGGNTGTAAGSVIAFQNAGGYIGEIGNYSAIHGNAYNANFEINGNNGIYLNPGGNEPVIIGTQTVSPGNEQLQVSGTSRFAGQVTIDGTGIGNGLNLTDGIITTIADNSIGFNFAAVSFTNQSSQGYGAYIQGGNSTKYSLEVANYQGTPVMSVLGDGTTSIIGNLGVGVASPQANFQVGQTPSAPGTVSTSGTTVTGSGTQFLNTFAVGSTITVNGETRTVASIASNTSMTTDAWTTTNTNAAYTVSVRTNFSVLGNGNVGIGTVNPSYSLDVSGSIGGIRVRNGVLTLERTDQLNSDTGFAATITYSSNATLDTSAAIRAAGGVYGTNTLATTSNSLTLNGPTNTLLADAGTSSNAFLINTSGVHTGGNLFLVQNQGIDKFAITDAGDASGVSFTANGGYLSSTFSAGAAGLNPPITSGGAAFGWNRSNGNGEADFISNANGAAAGGFNFFDLNGSTLTSLMTVLKNGHVGIGIGAPQNQFGVTPLQYSAGTASQSGTTVTGVGTTFTSAMVGSQFVFGNYGDEGTITAVADATHLTVTNSDTHPSDTFSITYTGLQVGSTGKVGIGTLSPTLALQVQGTSGQFVGSDVSASNPSLVIQAGTSSDVDPSISFRNQNGTVLESIDGNLTQGMYFDSVPGSYHFRNSNGIDRLTILGNGNVGVGIIFPTNAFAVSPSQYSTGTASQSGTTITGVGTTFTSAMIGSQFVFGDSHNEGTITAVADATHLTVTNIDTESAAPYTIYYTGLQVDNKGKVAIGTNTPTSVLTIAGNQSASAWGINGINFQTAAATYTDTSSSGTNSGIAINSFGIPTLAVSNTTTYDNASTLYIAGAPLAGTNATITNPYALNVASGTSYFGGSTITAGNITVGQSSSISSNVKIGILGSLSPGTGNAYGVYASYSIPSTVSHAYSFDSIPTIAPSSAIVNLDHFFASLQTIPVSSSIGTQVGFNADSSLIGAGSNYGFYGQIPAGTGNWNFYAQGTANNFFAGNVAIGALNTSGVLTLGGNQSASAWGVNGINFQTAAATYTDTSSSGIVSDVVINSIGTPTIAASNPTTYTNASTLYIAGAPVAGSNVTLSSPLSLNVASGNSYLGGKVGIGAAIQVVSGPSLQIAPDTANDNTNYGHGLQITRDASNTAQYLALVRSGNGAWSVGMDYNTSNFAIGTAQATDSNFTGSTNIKFLIDTAGHVGIGTTAPGVLLSVGSSVVTTGTTVAHFENAGGTCDIVPSTTGGITCSSDMNLKKNITNLADDSTWSFNSNIAVANSSDLDKILALNPVNYNWNIEQDSDSKHAGFIAQEVQQIFPDLVITNPATHLLSLNYTGFIPYTIEAIKEMNLKVTGIDDLTKSNSWRDAFIAWFADSANGITNLFAKKITTDELCVGTTCVTQQQFLQLIQNSNNSSSGTSSVSNPPTDSGSSDTTTPPDSTATPDTTTVTPDSSADTTTSTDSGQAGTTSDTTDTTSPVTN